MLMDSYECFVAPMTDFMGPGWRSDASKAERSNPAILLPKSKWLESQLQRRKSSSSNDHMKMMSLNEMQRARCGLRLC